MWWVSPGCQDADLAAIRKAARQVEPKPGARLIFDWFEVIIQIRGKTTEAMRSLSFANPGRTSHLGSPNFMSAS